MPTPDWSPPTGDSKLGPLDRISCGDQAAHHGTRLDANWLPFVPGTRTPLPGDHQLEHEPQETPDEFRDVGPEWGLIEVPRYRLHVDGKISPDNRRVLDDGVIHGFGTPGKRRLTIRGPIDLPTSRSGDVLQPEDIELHGPRCFWGPESDLIVALPSVRRQPGQLRSRVSGQPVLGINVSAGTLRWWFLAPDDASEVIGPFGPRRLMALPMAARLLVFDPATGVVVDEIAVGGSARWHPPRVEPSEDGTRVAVARYDARHVVVEPIPRGSTLARIELKGRLRQHATNLSISACNRYLLANIHSSAAIHDLQTGRVAHELGNHRVRAAAPTGMRVVAWTNENELHLGGVEDGQVRQRWTYRFPIDLRPGAMRFSPDGTLVTCGGVVFRVADGEPLTPPLSWRQRLHGHTWLKNRELLTSNGTVLDCDTLRVIDEFPELQGSDPTVSPDRRFAAVIANYRRLMVMDLRNRTLAYQGPDLEPRPNPFAPQFSPDSRMVSSGHSAVNLETGDVFDIAEPLAGRPLAFTDDNLLLALVSSQRGLVIVDPQRGDLELQHRTARLRRAKRAAFTPDGKVLLLELPDGSHRWLNVETGALLRRPAGNPDDLLPPIVPLPQPASGESEYQVSGSVSPDGQRAALLVDGELLVYRRRVGARRRH